MLRPRLVKDIFPGLRFLDEPNNSNPELLTGVGDTLYFIATDDVAGRELWRSDGSIQGTRRIADLNPGTYSPFGLIEFAGALYFSATTDIPWRNDLWRSDGTSIGTVKITDAFPDGGGLLNGVSRSTQTEMVRTKNFIYFKARKQTTRNFPNGAVVDESIIDIWRSDGTAAGTERIRALDIPGLVPVDNGGGLFPFRPSLLTPVGETLFFSALDGLGRELWKTNGTLNGTVRVADLRPGIYSYSRSSFTDLSSSNPEQLTALGNTLFFTADDGARGRELWKSDGTAAGTTRVKDIRFGVFGSDPKELTVVGNTLYFTADDGISGRELWRSDGTAAGTFRVADINTRSSSVPINLTAVGNTLFFSADAGSSKGGRELWKTNGTTSGTVLVADINNGDDDSDPENLTAAGNTLYFTAFDGFSNLSRERRGTELWKSDGTAKGTVLVADIAPGDSGSDPSSLTVVGNRLFFSADDKKKDIGSTGRELWVLDLPPTTSTPSLQSITVEGSRLVLRFSEPIQFSRSVGERFAVTVAGGSRSVLASQAGATNSELLLTLNGPAPTSSQIVRVQYTDLSKNNDGFGVIQDKAGNDLDSIVAPGRAADTFRSSGSVSTLAATTTNLVLTGSRTINGKGNNLPNTLTGNGAANSLNGGAAADRLIGGGGNDTLTGGFGADIFRFESALNSATNRDTITDFNPFQGDRIELENAVFKGLTRSGSLAPTAFRSGNTFTSASQRVLYNPANGNLTYDSNGNASGGINALIAVMSTKPNLTHSMLIVT